MVKLWKIVDLTHTIADGMPVFKAYWHPKVKIVRLGRITVEGRETRKIILGSHTGTHVDAPLHFITDGKSIDQLTLEKMIGEVEILHLVHLKEGQVVTPDMLGNIRCKRIIFNFGWHKKWGSADFFKGYPYLSTETAEHLVSKGVVLVALDTPSPDKSYPSRGCNLESPIHKILLENEVVIVEYLANLDKVDGRRGWNIIVMPLKIKDSDGAPARVCVFK